MDLYQLLLTLEASCCALERPGVPQPIQSKLNDLRQELDVYFEQNAPQSLDRFLDDQKKAILLLASDPKLFGGAS